MDKLTRRRFSGLFCGHGAQSIGQRCTLWALWVYVHAAPHRLWKALPFVQGSECAQCAQLGLTYGHRYQREANADADATAAAQDCTCGAPAGAKTMLHSQGLHSQALAGTCGLTEAWFGTAEGEGPQLPIIFLPHCSDCKHSEPTQLNRTRSGEARTARG